MTFESLLGEREVAQCLAVSVATVRRWRLLGNGPKFLKIIGSVRYRAADVKAFLDMQPTGGSGAAVEVSLGR